MLITHRKHKSRLQDLKNSVLIKSLSAWQKHSIHCLTTQNFLGRPENFEITVSNVRISNGAGFIVVETGNILVMPGLPKVPAADNIDVDADGKITGLF